MKAAIVSEFRKVRTTRTVWGLATGVTAVTCLGAWGSLTGISAAGGTLASLPLFLAASLAVTLFSMVLGVRSYTDEARHGSIVPTLLATPNRRRVVAAKLVVVSATAALFGLLAAVVGSGFALVWFMAHGTSIAIGIPTLAVVVAKMMALGAVWSPIGVGVGLVVRHQVAAIVGSLIYLLVVEGLIAALAANAGRFLPWNATRAVLGMSSADVPLVAPLVGAALLAGYVALSVVTGTQRFMARDVT